ncbi:MAG: phosphate ABC transporter permease subunit PstC [Acidimicrobiales bacterium]
MTAPRINGADRVDITSPRTAADRAFRILLTACASMVLVVISAIVLFLAFQVGPAWRHQGIKLFTTDQYFAPAKVFGFGGVLLGSFVIAIVALVVASPIALALSLAINEYLPRAVRGVLISVIDLLAAIPSLIYGLWGKYFLDRHVYLTSKFLGHHAAFFPFFRVQGDQTGRSEFLAGIIVGIMILPLMTAISREVMSQCPREPCEAALALGGTRWGMISTVILPFSRNGIVGAGMLGLGRAMGETIAVSLVLSTTERFTSHILQPGGGSVSALIVRQFLSAGTLEKSALTAAGLTLFAVTLAINVGARVVVGRSARNA